MQSHQTEHADGFCAEEGNQSTFLSAAQPTDQGEESVVLLLLVVVVGGGTIFQSPMYSFLGCEKAKTLSKKRCDKAKTLSKKGCDKATTLSKKGVTRQKLCLKRG